MAKDRQRMAKNGKKRSRTIEAELLNTKTCMPVGLTRLTPYKFKCYDQESSLTNLDNLDKCPRRSCFNVSILINATSKHSDFDTAIALLCFI